jgi:hypothetical protein
MKSIFLLLVVLTVSIACYGQFSLLKDINQTEAGSNPQNVIEVNGVVFFTVQTIDGTEIDTGFGTLYHYLNKQNFLLKLRRNKRL